MAKDKKTTITVETTVNAPIEQVWKKWTNPDDVVNWNSASEDWHTPWAENDLRDGGKFSFRMESKDGSMGFDFGGVYDKVKKHELIEYTMGDGREVKVSFFPENGKVRVVETFDAETVHSIDMQRDGWQAIMNNFKKYAEAGK